MATKEEKIAVREFMGEAFSDALMPANPELIVDFIADLIYGDTQKVKETKDKYKAFLDSKIAKADAALAKLDQDKLDAQTKLQDEKAKKQAEKDKLKDK